MTILGILAKSNTALVKSAGVGFPSGVIGITSMVLQNPYWRNSESAGGVNLIKSGSAPATVMPGISQVSV